jgi:hypothetical protein
MRVLLEVEFGEVLQCLAATAGAHDLRGREPPDDLRTGRRDRGRAQHDHPAAPRSDLECQPDRGPVGRDRDHR